MRNKSYFVHFFIIKYIDYHIQIDYIIEQSKSLRSGIPAEKKEVFL